MSNDDGKEGILNGFTIINTNARSLCPKVNSLVDCFEEVGADIGIITETWMSDGEGLEDDILNFELGSGLGMLCSCLLYTSPSPRD